MIPPSGTIAFWVVALVVFLIVEAVTAGLVSIWFVFGSLVALICAALGAAVWLQIFWFVIVSVATLVLTRPLVKRYVDSRSVATNCRPQHRPRRRCHRAHRQSRRHRRP